MVRAVLVSLILSGSFGLRLLNLPRTAVGFARRCGSIGARIRRFLHSRRFATWARRRPHSANWPTAAPIVYSDAEWKSRPTLVTNTLPWRL